MNKRKSAGQLRKTTKRSRPNPSKKKIGLRLPSYAGPIRTRSDLDSRELTERVILLNFAITTSGAGLYNTVISNNPGASPSWASLAAIYDEYRVLGMEAHFTPNNRYNFPTTVGLDPFATVLDRSDATALASYTGTTPAADEYVSHMMFTSSDPWTRVIKMSDYAEADFIPTSAPAATFWIKPYFLAATAASTNLGFMTVLWRIQFKGGQP